MKKSLRGLGTQQANPKSSTEAGWEHFKTMAFHSLPESRRQPALPIEGWMELSASTATERSAPSKSQSSFLKITAYAGQHAQCPLQHFATTCKYSSAKIAALHPHAVRELSACAPLSEPTGSLKVRPPHMKVMLAFSM